MYDLGNDELVCDACGSRLFLETYPFFVYCPNKKCEGTSYERRSEVQAALIRNLAKGVKLNQQKEET